MIRRSLIRTLELVFGKVCFLVNCQSLNEFGGTGIVIFEAMKNTIATDMSEEALKKMLICIAADWATVNFGKYQN